MNKLLTLLLATAIAAPLVTTDMRAELSNNAKGALFVGAGVSALLGSYWTFVTGANEYDCAQAEIHAAHANDDHYDQIILGDTLNGYTPNQSYIAAKVVTLKKYLREKGYSAQAIAKIIAGILLYGGGCAAVGYGLTVKVK